MNEENGNKMKKKKRVLHHSKERGKWKKGESEQNWFTLKSRGKRKEEKTKRIAPFQNQNKENCEDIKNEI